MLRRAAHSLVGRLTMGSCGSGAFRQLGPVGNTLIIGPAGDSRKFQPAGDTLNFQPAGKTLNFQPAGDTTVRTSIHPTACLLATDSALDRLRALRKSHPAHVLSVTVSPGGCHGFQYGFALSKTIDLLKKERYVFEPAHDAMAVAVDSCSMDMLVGATLDHVSEPIGESFRIRPHTSQASCGCGVSFGPRD